MVKILLQGGLGNQMFQYAAAKSLSLIKGGTVVLDLSFLEQNFVSFEGFTPRKYELCCFSLGEKIQSNKQKNVAKHISSLFSSIKNKLTFRKHHYYSENSIKYDPSFFNVEIPVYLKGYFQSEKYFKSIKGQLFEIFKFPSLPHNTIPFFLDEIQNTLSVAVHVRRGDFVTSIKTNAYHGVCEKIYYTLAMQEIQRKIKSCKFFFFSDDHEWVRQNLIINDSTILVETNNMPLWYDMYLMTQCKHNILANSSYSWWGAWLNQNESKIVIAPKKWFADDKMNMQTSDLIPKEWIRL